MIDDDSQFRHWDDVVRGMKVERANIKRKPLTVNQKKQWLIDNKIVPELFLDEAIYLLKDHPETFRSIKSECYGRDGRVMRHALLVLVNGDEFNYARDLGNRDPLIKKIRALIADLANERGTPIQLCNSAVICSKSATRASWAVAEIKRASGYRIPLYDFLVAACRAGKAVPSARDVLDAWRAKKPAEVHEILSDELKYYDAHGGVKSTSLRGITKSINRLIIRLN